MKTICSLLALLIFTAELNGAQPFTITLTDQFEGPEVSSMGGAHSFGYTRPSTMPGIKSLFLVSVVPIPPEGKGDSLETLLSGMLGGIERQRTAFTKSAYSKTKLGGEEGLAVDWEGTGKGLKMKGRMICARSQGRLVCVHLQDLAGAWPKTLPAFEKLLGSFAIAK